MSADTLTGIRNRLAQGEELTAEDRAAVVKALGLLAQVALGLADHGVRTLPGPAANDDGHHAPPAASAEVRGWYARRHAAGQGGTEKADWAAAVAAFGPVVPRKLVRALRAEFRPVGGRKPGPRGSRREFAPRRI